jgi:hypothetical protein
MACRQDAHGETLVRCLVSLRDEIADHRHERRSCANRRHPGELHAETLAQVGCFRIEVVENFHVV